MQSAKLAGKIGVIAAIALGAFAVSGHQAAAASDSMAKVDSAMLFKGPLAAMPGFNVIVKRFAVPPGFVGKKHFHPGQVFIYVLEGGISLDRGGDAPLILEAGDLFEEPLGEAMRGRNRSADDWAKFVVFQIGEEGKPMMVMSE